MKKLIVPIVILMLSTAALGQSRSRQTTKKTTTPAASKTSTAGAASEARTKGATTVANQIKNLTTFLYILGGVAKEIEALDAAAKSGQASPTNEKNKAQLRQSFQDFRVGLDQLEISFRSTPELQPFYIKLAGSAASAADAEAKANVGQFNQAGRALLSVVGRLADVLVAMP